MLIGFMARYADSCHRADLTDAATLDNVQRILMFWLVLSVVATAKIRAGKWVGKS